MLNGAPVWTRKIDFLTSDGVFFFFSTGDDVGEGENVRGAGCNGLGRFFFLPPSAAEAGVRGDIKLSA